MLNFFRQTSSACAATNSHRAQVQQALDALASGLRPWVMQAMSQRYGQRWYLHHTIRNLYAGPDYGLEGPTFDLHLLLRIVLRQSYWGQVFRSRLDGIDYATITYLLGLRNRSAHYDGTDQLFHDPELVEKALITIKQVLKAIGSTQELDQVQSLHDQLRPSFGQRLWQACQRHQPDWQPMVLGLATVVMTMGAIATTSSVGETRISERQALTCPR
ncbi:Swt1 family HEPN domain-containing protein [Synechococcus elongatus]|uniref:Swt1 family HEPN domain-containing protein n=1 Tax=Synechococcus elongatus TaxID=32046 RepID=UPI0030CCAFB5